uniref:POTRA domain-containing protein n=1 Tax=Asparagopsis taxiformis TaxID=260499 RepID=A0A1C9CC09_9FLOR|nr:hypothetical protein Aspa_054 [Asparagopsis taxiformis]AOM65933.1 hypothetical protein Aspa_054 [Asparagopsis taxiformis]
MKNIILSIFHKTIHLLYIVLLTINYNLLWIYGQYKITTLAFNGNIDVTYPNKQINNYTFSFEDYNNIFYKNKFLKLLKIKIFYVKKNRYSNNYLYNIINHLNKSGFIKAIKVSINIENNKNYFCFNIKLNSIVKIIKIKNISTLLIPKKILMQAFNMQIGLPKNYIHIHKSLKIIKNWYHVRGFKWLQINLVEDNQHNICIEVNEGIIKENIFFCKNSYNQSIDSRLQTLIQKELNIKPGKIINLKKIELGIINLKDNQLITNCNYQVIHNSYNDIVIIIKYSLKNDRFSYLFTKNIGLLYLSQVNWFNIMKFIFYTPIQKIPSIFFSLNQYLGFQYFLSQINNYNLRIDLRNINNFINLNYISSYSYLNIHKNLTSHLRIHILNKKYKIDNPNAISIIKQYNTKRDKSIKTLNYYGLNILFKHNSVYSTYLEEKFVIYHSRSHKKNINIRNYSYSLDPYFYLTKKIIQLIQQTFISFKLYFKYNTLNFNHKNLIGRFLVICSEHIINTSFQPFNSLYLFKHLGQNLYFKYQETFLVSSIIQTLKNNIIIILIESQLSLFDTPYIKVFDEHYLLQQTKYLLSSLASYKFNIEYQITNTFYYTFYTYLDYKNNISLSQDSLNLITSYIINNNHNYTAGIGLQLNIPINRIPSFRLEYVVDGKNHCFQLKSYSKYTQQ